MSSIKRIALGVFELAPGRDLPHPRVIHIGQHAGVVVASREALLIQAQIAHRLLAATRQAAFDRACNNAVDRVPVQLDQAGHAADVRRCCSSRTTNASIISVMRL